MVECCNFFSTNFPQFLTGIFVFFGRSSAELFGRTFGGNGRTVRVRPNHVFWPFGRSLDQIHFKNTEEMGIRQMSFVWYIVDPFP